LTRILRYDLRKTSIRPIPIRPDEFNEIGQIVKLSHQLKRAGTIVEYFYGEMVITGQKLSDRKLLRGG
jgi:hypothetical protein